MKNNSMFEEDWNKGWHFAGTALHPHLSGGTAFTYDLYRNIDGFMFDPIHKCEYCGSKFASDFILHVCPQCGAPY